MNRYKRKFNEALREVEITFSDGSKLETNMAAHLTDDEIKDYYKIGSSFNIGTVEDKMVKVKSVKILK
jgi:argininosuccinate synthase